MCVNSPKLGLVSTIAPLLRFLPRDVPLPSFCVGCQVTGNTYIAELQAPMSNFTSFPLKKILKVGVGEFPPLSFIVL